MKIGLCTPLNPQHSGISDYCEELIPVLGQTCEIVVFSPVVAENKSLEKSFLIYDISDLDRADIRNSLDIIVYHIGNCYEFHAEIVKMFFKYGGIAELHDISLFHLAAGMAFAEKNLEWLANEAEYSHGSYGKKVIREYMDGAIPAPWESMGPEMTMNRRFIANAKGIIVHSDFARQAVLAVRPDVPVATIRLHAPVKETDTCGLRKKLGIDSNKVVFGSFGFASPSKRITSVLEAISLLSEDIKKRILYLIVGEVPVGSALTVLIQEKGLEDIVKITGRVPMEEYECYLGACDFCFNLRYPSQGETSGSLHRMFGMGKPAVVTDIAAFSEYPDEVCVKISSGDSEVSEISSLICQLYSDREKLDRMSRAAKEYAMESCDIQNNAHDYAAFFEKVLHLSWTPEFEDTLITNMMELGLTSEEYVGHVSQIADSMNTD